jgi:hypothetical protein
MLKRCLALTGMVVLLMTAGWCTFGRHAEIEYTEYKVEAGSPGIRPAAWIDRDQRTVMISCYGGDLDMRVQVKVRETADTVKIAITVRESTGLSDLVAYGRGYKITLHSPLGSRKLIGIDDVPYDRTGERPVERARAGDQEIPVKIGYEK